MQTNNSSPDTLFQFFHNEIVSYFEEDISDLEFIGFAAGYRIIESLTKDWPRFKEELDIMKFLCTDFWFAINKKQIDNLRTNYQGNYTLLDNDFRFMSNISNGVQYLEKVPKYAAYTCGLLRGALANMGFICAVTAEIHSTPICKFNINVNR